MTCKRSLVRVQCRPPLGLRRGTNQHDLRRRTVLGEARRDIERLAAHAEADPAALEREDVFGGGDAGLMGEIIIKWTDRDFFC